MFYTVLTFSIDKLENNWGIKVGRVSSSEHLFFASCKNYQYLPIDIQYKQQMYLKL